MALCCTADGLREKSTVAFAEDLEFRSFDVDLEEINSWK